MQDHAQDPVWKQALAGSQMLLVAFGALVLMPLITGLDPNVALFTAGIGTLIFHLVTGGQIPIFLASSFAFIAPILAAKTRFGLEETLGRTDGRGAAVCRAQRRHQAAWHRFHLPAAATGGDRAGDHDHRGLGLAPIAVHMASGRTGDGSAVLVPYDTAIWVAMTSLLVTIVVAVWAKGIFRMIPIMFGVLVGYALSAVLGIVDTSPIAEAPWFAVPNFVTPEFSWSAVLFMLPVAIAPAIEHIGDILAIGNVTRKNYLEKPGLHRTLLGDGLATSAASMLGGPPNTTYSEVTGAVMLTRNFNPRIMWWAAIVAIVLAFVGKFGAALQTIPAPVMGGILCLLFGSIAVVGLNTLIRNQVDLSQSRNLVIVGVTLVFGIGNLVLGQLEGIALCAVVAVVLNLVLPGSKEAWGKRVNEPATD